MSVSEEWTVVTSQDKRRVIRSGRRRRALPNDTSSHTNNSNSETPSNDKTKNAVVNTMTKCQATLEYTSFFQNVKRFILEKHEIQQIVCYGIGNLSTSPSASMWQLACALALREAMHQQDNNTVDIPVFFYDPCTITSESDLMKEEWKVHVLSENERGKRNVDGLATLFFMPHCPLALYGNALWVNWNNLNRIVLFGNSLPLYQERALEKNKIPETVSLLLPFVQQERIDVSKRDAKTVEGDLEGAFNDCYLTWFSIDNDTVLSPRPPESATKDDDGEVI